MATELILASASPRRRDILGQLGIRFEVVPGEVEELTAGDAEQVARENATRKARAVAERSAPDATVLGADTVVDLDGRLLPKPRDAGQAREWLRTLSGREHRVVSAVCVARGGDVQAAVSATAVRFRALTDAEIDWYVRAGEWRDRAGGYAIQGRGAALVASVCGDYWTVVGLPVPALVELVGPHLLTGG